MERVIKIFMERDGNSREEAEQQLNKIRGEILELIETGTPYDEIVECWESDTGLESDYLEDILP